MSRPKGCRTTSRRMLTEAQSLEAILGKIDAAIAAGQVDVKLLRERAKLSSLYQRALREGEALRHRRRRS